MTEDHLKKAALNACELLEVWTGDTVIPFKDFRQLHQRACDLNLRIANGELIVMHKAEYQKLLDNQKKRR